MYFLLTYQSGTVETKFGSPSRWSVPDFLWNWQIITKLDGQNFHRLRMNFTKKSCTNISRCTSCTLFRSQDRIKTLLNADNIFKHKFESNDN